MSIQARAGVAELTRLVAGKSVRLPGVEEPRVSEDEDPVVDGLEELRDSVAGPRVADDLRIIQDVPQVENDPGPLPPGVEMAQGRQDLRLHPERHVVDHEHVGSEALRRAPDQLAPDLLDPTEGHAQVARLVPVLARLDDGWELHEVGVLRKRHVGSDRRSRQDQDRDVLPASPHGACNPQGPRQMTEPVRVVRVHQDAKCPVPAHGIRPLQFSCALPRLGRMKVRFDTDEDLVNGRSHGCANLDRMSKRARKGAKSVSGLQVDPGGGGPRWDAADLVRHCLAGYDEAWAEFLRRYGDLIYATLRRKAGLGGADLEDAYQDTIVSIHRNLPLLREPQKIISWIIQIAYREGINRVRASIRARGHGLESVDPGWFDTIPDEGGVDRKQPGTEDSIDLERAQHVREAYLILPQRCRTLLELLFYRDPAPDYRDISRQLGIPVGSIGPTRARCLEKLRKLFSDKGWID
ncbi:MAG: sigma-70 family RNA polymerase sigma factor [Candidatus Eisenbacteria bacterium]|nr:sigma-70 family RNA polymerase sigma factor [Candidatus Latescibacterota bacterium]MBD3302335.1 sigma-70 family RNA polymerase sigma factor [Candidatus Eisenbacteria bacterium]